MSSNLDKLYVARLSTLATIPTRESSDAAGYDLYSAYEYSLPPGGKILVHTDIQIKLPQGTYGRIASRSGLAANHHIHVGAGVIDRNYRGNIIVILFNLGKDEYLIHKGDRIAQLICERIMYPELEIVHQLDMTARGSNGFGSTGKN